MTPTQIKLKPNLSSSLGPVGRVRAKKALAVNANLMASTGRSERGKIRAVEKAQKSWIVQTLVNPNSNWIIPHDSA